MSLCKIYEKTAVINFKDKKYKDYIKNSSLKLFNLTIGLAIQGRKNELTEIITYKPFKEFFVETKMNKSFKELGFSEKESEFYPKLQSYFVSNKEKLTELCKIYNNITSFDEIKDGESIGEYISNILSNNQVFVDIYKTLDEKEFSILVDNQLNKI